MQGPESIEIWNPTMNFGARCILYVRKYIVKNMVFWFITSCSSQCLMFCKNQYPQSSANCNPIGKSTEALAQNTACFSHSLYFTQNGEWLILSCNFWFSLNYKYMILKPKITYHLHTHRSANLKSNIRHCFMTYDISSTTDTEQNL
jgi:hypothetical protein